MAVIASIFFVIACGVAVTGIYLLPKTENRILGAVWLPVSFMVLCCIQTFSAAVFSLIYVPINLWTIGSVNMLLGIVLWWQIRKEKKVQDYSYGLVDGVVFGLLLLLLAGFMWVTYGANLDIHYHAIDAMVHMKNAMIVMYDETVSDMFFSPLQHGMLLQLLAPLFDADVYYKIYIVSDSLHLLFSWCMCYAVIRRFATDRFLKRIAVLVTCMYAAGYPMNSNLFGFTYLGTAATITAYLLIVTELYLEEEIDGKWSVFMLSLGCLAIFQCYVLFMPVAFFGIATALLIKQKRKGELISVTTLKQGVAIFLAPTALGLIHTYMGIFADRGVSIGSAISVEGGIYKNLYSNFLIWLPFALLAMYKLIKSKKNSILMIFTAMLLLFMLGMLALGIFGMVSAYYFYKCYNILWLLLIVLAYMGLTYLRGDGRFLAGTVFATWFIVFAAFLLNAEGFIQNKNPMFVQDIRAPLYNDIYSFNIGFCRSASYDAGNTELFAYMAENMVRGEDEIAAAGELEDYYYLEGITGRDQPIEYMYWRVGEDVYFEYLNEHTDYVVILYDAEFYEKYQTFFDGLERVYQNEAGYIAKMK